MGSVVKNLRCASLRSALQRCGALSPRHSVPSMWNYSDIRSGRPGCPGTWPQTIPGTLPRHTDHQNRSDRSIFSIFVGGYKNIAVTEKREESPEILFCSQGKG